MFWRSKDNLQFPEGAMVRGLYKSMGTMTCPGR
jgi:hypothetical protein